MRPTRESERTAIKEKGNKSKAVKPGKLSRRPRRTEPFAKDLDPFGQWVYFKQLIQIELSNWRKWQDAVNSHSTQERIDRGLVIPEFPILSAIRFLWKSASAPNIPENTKELYAISNAQIEAEMGRYSKIRKGIVKRITDFLKGKSSPNNVKVSLTDPGLDPETDTNGQAERPVTALLLWDFSVSLVYLMADTQQSQGPSRQSGTISTNIVNQRIRDHKYATKAKGQKLTSPISEVVIEKIGDELDERLAEYRFDIFHKLMAMADEMPYPLGILEQSNEMEFGPSPRPRQ